LKLRVMSDCDSNMTLVENFARRLFGPRGWGRRTTEHWSWPRQSQPFGASWSSTELGALTAERAWVTVARFQLERREKGKRKRVFLC
jgi:hypothetical protein